MGRQSDLLAQHRRVRQPSGPPSTGSEPGQGLKGSGHWRWLAGLLLAAAVAGTTYALFHFVLWSRVPSQMAGKWLVRGGDLDGATLEFFRNGTMIGTVNMQGNQGKINGKVKIEGDKLYVTTLHPLTGSAVTDTQTIRSLTDEEFVLVDSKGKAIKMERLE